MAQRVRRSPLALNATQIIDVTATEAFLVRKDADGGDIFTVDTTNGKVIFGSASNLGSATHPIIAFGSTSSNTGFYIPSADRVGFASDGVAYLFLDSDGISGVTAGSSLMSRKVASATVPVFTFNDDTNSGIGHQAADNVSIICGALEAIRAEDPADLGATETSLWLYDLDNAAIQQVTVGAADSGGTGYKLLRIVN
jgi:hypothetical protein